MEPHEQRERHGSQAGTQAPPETGHAQTEPETDVECRRESDQPVSDHVREKGEGRITRPTQDPASDRLDTILDLEHRRDRQQGYDR